MQAVDRRARGGGDVDPLDGEDEVDLRRGEVGRAGRARVRPAGSVPRRRWSASTALSGPAFVTPTANLALAERDRPERRGDHHLGGFPALDELARPAPRAAATRPSAPLHALARSARWTESSVRRSNSFRDFSPSTPTLNAALSIAAARTHGFAVLVGRGDLEGDVVDVVFRRARHRAVGVDGRGEIALERAEVEGLADVGRLGA